MLCTSGSPKTLIPGPRTTYGTRFFFILLILNLFYDLGNDMAISMDEDKVLKL